MDETILITELNDFIFCPVSIYFHKLYGNLDRMVYQSRDQINGTNAHNKIDNSKYSTKTSVLQGMDVYCEKYDIVGKIDIFYADKFILRERKKKIKQVFDGYIFQVYAQYFSLIEMGYEVKKIELYSMDDNRIYNIPMPYENLLMFEKFEKVIKDIREFNMEVFVQNNTEKCKHCIYEPACDRSLLENA